MHSPTDIERLDVDQLDSLVDNGPRRHRQRRNRARARAEVCRRAAAVAHKPHLGPLIDLLANLAGCSPKLPYPSMEWMGRALGRHPDTIRAQVAECERLGLLQVYRSSARPDRNNAGKFTRPTNRYLLCDGIAGRTARDTPRQRTMAEITAAAAEKRLEALQGRLAAIHAEGGAEAVLVAVALAEAGESFLVRPTGRAHPVTPVGTYLAGAAHEASGPPEPCEINGTTNVAAKAAAVVGPERVAEPVEGGTEPEWRPPSAEERARVRALRAALDAGPLATVRRGRR